MKYWVQLFYILCIWGAQSFTVGETKSINDDISARIDSCDYTQLEGIKLQAEINHESQLRQQKELFGNLERKITDLASKMEGIQDKLFDFIRAESQAQVRPVTPTVDDNILIMSGIKRYDLEDHTQILKNTMSDNLVSLQKIDEKLKAIEDNTMPKIDQMKFYQDIQQQLSKNYVDDKIVIMNGIKVKLELHEEILNKIIDNQNATRQLIKDINLEDHTQILKNTMSDNLVSLQKMDDKLKAIEDNTMPKIDQVKFYQDIQQQLNSTEIYLRGENHSLSSTNQSYPTSCANFNANYCADNKCLIKNDVCGPEPFLVACNNSVDGGGWMVIQRRINGAVDFYRGWDEYKTGFGDLDGEFFIGLEKLSALTSTLKPVELLIQLQDFDNILKYAKYDNFQVGNEYTNYTLIDVGSYTGDAGDSFSWHKNLKFSTKDRDNDIGDGNCAILRTGAWWYGNCAQSNLNGKYYHEPKDISSEDAISWVTFRGYYYSLKFVQMLIRPRKL